MHLQDRGHRSTRTLVWLEGTIGLEEGEKGDVHMKERE